MSLTTTSMKLLYSKANYFSSFMNLQNKYWVRTSAGLEHIFVQELEAKLPSNVFDIKHKSVFFQLNESNIAESQLTTCLKTADDIYKFLGHCDGIDNTKLSTENIIKYFEHNVLPELESISSKAFRITVSFLGTRNFNRFYIENLLNIILESKTKAYILSNEKGDKWMEGEKRIRIHIEDNKAYFGIGLQDKPLHRRQWRVNSYTAQLHPPLAAAMVFIANTPKGAKIIDPFSGSGTILVESALQNNISQHIGFDIEKSAIQIAIENSNLAQTNIEFHNEEFFNSYKSFGNYFIITNPPWGEKHMIDPKGENLFIQKLIDIIAQSQGAVILIPQELVDKLKNRGFDLKEIFQTRVRGKLASVILISNKNESFNNNSAHS